MQPERPRSRRCPALMKQGLCGFDLIETTSTLRSSNERRRRMEEAGRRGAYAALGRRLSQRELRYLAESEVWHEFRYLCARNRMPALHDQTNEDMRTGPKIEEWILKGLESYRGAREHGVVVAAHRSKAADRYIAQLRARRLSQ